MKAGGILRLWVALTALALGGLAFANPEPWQLNMTSGVTETSAQVYRLHMMILSICAVIGLIVFGAMAFAIVKFRKSNGAVAAQFSHNTKAEIIWTIIPVLILIAMAWPATNTLLAMADTSGAQMTVKITGYQWMWRYEILDYQGKATPVNFLSRLDSQSDHARQLGSGLSPQDVTDNGINAYLLNVNKPLVLPIDTKIRFVLTADDVIHAWWVPTLGWKQDAIPGVINERWTEIRQPGVYRGQCAELCGKDHGFMPVVVRAVPRAEFESWLAAESAAATAAAPSAQTTPIAAPAKG